MANTVEQEIFDEIIDLLKDISIVNGYSFDLDERVDEWRDIPYEDEMLPVVDVRDPGNDSDDEDEDLRRYQIDVRLYDNGTTAPAKVREKAQDVLNAVKLLRDHTEVETVEFLGSEKEIAKGAKTFSCITLRFVVLYHAEYFTI
jgi:hypothetical protein